MAAKLLIATDAWEPQINGVVKTVQTTIAELKRQGFAVEVISPQLFLTFPMPLYPEIKLSLPNTRRVARSIEEFSPDHIHIVTEGPIGLMTRRYCLKHSLKFSTSFHTMFPSYCQHFTGIPERYTWPYFSWFHRPSSQVMVPSESIQQVLLDLGLPSVSIWSRGINLERFNPSFRDPTLEGRPIALYVGRVSKEKSIEDFLRLRVPGRKWVVGDGPIRKRLEKLYPDAEFLGYKRGVDLATAFANADVFVFPSKTETFGNVMLEALASGVPVAAYPAPGPVDVLHSPEYGCCDEDLQRATDCALEHGKREKCIEYARQFTWERATRQFQEALVPLRL